MGICEERIAKFVAETSFDARHRFAAGSLVLTNSISSGLHPAYSLVTARAAP